MIKKAVDFVMDKFYKLIGGVLIFIGLIWFMILFSSNALTSIPNIIMVAILLYGGYTLGKRKEVKQDITASNEIFVSSTIKKIVFILILVPFVLYLAKNNIDEKKLKFSHDISDAKNIKDTITIGFDDWQGYKYICSDSMKHELIKRGYLLKCISTGGNFKERFQKLENAEFDFALATMDSMIINAKDKTLGAVVALIDESNGGDAIMSKKYSSINELKNSNFSVGFIGDSPSSFLWGVVSDDFNLKSGANINQYSSDDEIKKSYKNAKDDLIVTWEPMVSEAKKYGYKKLIGSENISGLIVDVLVASSKTISQESEKIDTLLSTYFAIYPSLVKKIDGVKMFGINENRYFWDDDFVLRSMTNISKRLDMTLDNPYLLINSSFINKIVKDADIKNDTYYSSIKTQLQRGFKGFSFSKLNDSGWDMLRVVGNLKQENVAFKSGTAMLTNEAKDRLEEMAMIINQYRYRVLIKGHTSLMGDKMVNRELSNDRALSVYNYLTRVLDIDQNRLKYRGVGSDEPLAKRGDESLRNYNKRLKRVEFIFLK